MPEYRFDPEGWEEVKGDMPPGTEQGIFQEPFRENFNDRRKTAKKLLPEDDELLAKVEGQSVSADSIIVKLGHKAHEYSLKVVHKGSENKKAVLAITVTGAALYLITKSFHTKPKKKS